MKKLLIILILAISVLPGQNRPKVGLVLSGGGAKGVAHIEILKVLDSLNFPVDYIAGTSMGGLIGGFYAIGYNGNEIEKLIKSFNWKELFDDKPRRENLPYLVKKDDGHFIGSFEIKNYIPKPPDGLIAGQNILSTFAKYADPVSNINDFDKFKIPFRCVATDLITGKPVVLKHGYLPLAMRSTMSIPSVFSPVVWGDSLLVDGGILDNLPTDVARDMGAEWVLAINIGAPLKTREELVDMFSIMEQSFSIPGYFWEENNIKNSDMVITPDIRRFTSGDFTNEKIAEIMAEGHKSAMAFKDSLIKIMRSWGLNPNEERESTNLSERLANIHETVPLKEVKIFGNKMVPNDEIMKMTGLDSIKAISPNQFKKIGNVLENSGLFTFTEVSYTMSNDSGIKLAIRLKEKKKPIIHSIVITGNKKFSFPFIYSLLKINPGDRFDPDKLNKKIQKLFGLGYFRTIYYTLEPYNAERVVVHIWITENETNSLSVGVRYNDSYKLIAVLALKSSNFFINGLRSELYTELSGITRLSWELSFPSATLDFPVYPFFQIYFQDINQDFYWSEGHVIAEYKSKKTSYHLGLGTIIGKSTNIKLGFGYAERLFTPNIADPDFPELEYSRFNITGILRFDNLDNAVLPLSGLSAQGRYRSDLAENDDQSKRLLLYQQAEIFGQFFYPITPRDNVRLSGYYAFSYGDVPFDQYFHSMTPQTFFGMDYFSLRYTRLGACGFEYRRTIINDLLYASLIGNVGFMLDSPLYNTLGFTNSKPFYGMGFAAMLNTQAGLLTLKLGSHEKTPMAPSGRELWVNFTLGYPLGKMLF